MFTIEQIHEAFARVKSGEDFPRFVQDLKAIGVIYYDNFVADGRTKYFGVDNFVLDGGPKYPALSLSETSSAEQLRHAITIHQQGQTDYPTFCVQAAAAGVEKWTTHIGEMTVTYLDHRGRELLVEAIPEPLS